MPHSRAASGGRGQGQALQARRTAHTTHVVRNWRPAGRCGYVPARVSTHGITKAHLGLPARHRKVSWLLGFSSACSRRRAHAWRSVWMTTAAGSDDRRKGQGRAVRGRGARPPLAGQGLSETATCDRPAATLAAHQPHKGALPTGAATLDQGLAHSAVPLPIHALAKPNRGAQRAVAARLRCRAPPAHSPPPRLVSPPVNQPAAPCPQTKPPPMLLHPARLLCVVLAGHGYLPDSSRPKAAATSHGRHPFVSLRTWSFAEAVCDANHADLPSGKVVVIPDT